MDWMQFTASLAASLAWPAGVVVLGFTLKAAVVDLLQRVTTLEAGGVKLSVAARAAAAVEALEPSPSSIAIEHHAPSPASSELPQLSHGGDELPEVNPDRTGDRPTDTVAPSTTTPAVDAERTITSPASSKVFDREKVSVDGTSIIRSAWGRLQYALRRTLVASDVSWPGPMTDKRLVSMLAGKALISAETAEALESLRTIKNDVVSGRSRASYVDARAFETSTNLILTEIAGSFGDQSVAAAIFGQGDLATMNYDQLRDKLKAEFPIVGKPRADHPSK